MGRTLDYKVNRTQETQVSEDLWVGLILQNTLSLSVEALLLADSETKSHTQKVYFDKINYLVYQDSFINYHISLYHLDSGIFFPHQSEE